MLLRLGQADAVWPLLQHKPDPGLRSYLIHRLASLGAAPHDLMRRLPEEPDLSAKRALLLALGEFTTEQLPQTDRDALLPALRQLYQEDPDPGLHAAVEWLLRQWNKADWLQQVNKEWAQEKGKREGWWSAVTEQKTSLAPPHRLSLLLPGM